MPSAAPDGAGVGQARHPKAVEQTDQPGGNRHQQRDLQRPRAGVGVDPDDLLRDVLWLAGEETVVEDLDRR